jgi:hypothetical protein
MVSISGIAQAQEQAQEQVQEKQKTPGKVRKSYLSLGGGLLMIGDSPFGGGNFSFGYMPSSKNLFTFELGGGGGASQRIGSYGYTLRDGSGHIVETKNDGKITYSYSFFEGVVAWNRLFQMSNKWRFRVGPCIGVLSIIGGDHYSPTSYKGVTIDGIPDTKSESKTVPMGGIITGFTCDFSKRWFLDINYRLSVNPTVNFPERRWSALGNSVKIAEKEFGLISNRINLAVGVRL